MREFFLTFWGAVLFGALAAAAVLFTVLTLYLIVMLIAAIMAV